MGLHRTSYGESWRGRNDVLSDFNDEKMVDSRVFAEIVMYIEYL